jgi:hypothetical protein
VTNRHSGKDRLQAIHSWKEKKHPGEDGMFQYSAGERSREFGLSFSSSDNFPLSCEEISLTCRQIHLRGKCEFNVRRNA